MNMDEMLAMPLPLNDEDRRTVMRNLLRNMEVVSDSLMEFRSSMKFKPLIGGAFGAGRFVLGSWHYTSGKLDRVKYVVIEASSWLVVGTGQLPENAIADAREVVKLLDQMLFAQFCGRRLQDLHDRDRAIAEAQEAKRAEWRAAHKTKSIAKNIPRRRKEIFDKSEGKCHYCATALTLDGRWHIEHMQPRALLGPNDKSNLVAACVSCNMKKRDMTAEEFIAKRAS